MVTGEFAGSLFEDKHNKDIEDRCQKVDQEEGG